MQNTNQSIWDELNQWGETLENWQKYILYYAINEQKISDKRINEAYECFLKEKQIGGDDFDLMTVPQSMGVRKDNDINERVKLIALKNIKHVNALPEINEIKFGNQLTIFYGLNGSGKSSIARIFSSSCFSRATSKILNNIYLDNDLPPYWEIEIEVGNKKETHISSQGKADNLKSIRMFDQNESNIQLTQENELGFLPVGFDVFDEMVRVYGIIKEKLQSLINSKNQNNMFIDKFPGESEIKSNIISLSKGTNIEHLRMLIGNIDNKNKELIEVEKQISKLQSESIDSTVKSISEIIEIINKTYNNFKTQYSKLSSSSCQIYIESLVNLKEILIQRDKINLETHDLGFPLLNKTGTEDWINFVKSSELFAKKEASSYPEEGDICLLCHQILDVPSISLIKRFWGFVNSTARLEAEKLNKEIDRLVNDLENLNLCLLPKDSVNRDKLNIFAQDALNIFDNISTELTERRKVITLALKNSEISSFPSDEYAFKDTIVSTIISNLETKVKELQSNGFIAIELTKLNAKKLTLQHSILLNNNISLIDDYISEIRWISRANSAISEINTSHITTTSKSLYSKVITDKYKQALKSEEKILGFKLPYDLKHSGKSGKNVRKYQVTEKYKTTAIFSEAEQRILSLADFLVETNINQNSSAIILDDPVVSFDHKRRGMIAKRLVDESQKRQVIIFTHDIIFLYSLHEFATEISAKICTNWIKNSNNKIEIIIGDYPKNDKKIESVDLYNQRLKRAVKLYDESKDITHFIIDLRNCADTIRGGLESFIINNIFQGVIRRWQEELVISRLGDVNFDKSITDSVSNLYDDLCRFIDSHSHSAEYLEPPEASDIKDFINRMEIIITNWKKLKNKS